MSLLDENFDISTEDLLISELLKHIRKLIWKAPIRFEKQEHIDVEKILKDPDNYIIGRYVDFSGKLGDDVYYVMSIFKKTHGFSMYKGQFFLDLDWNLANILKW